MQRQLRVKDSMGNCGTVRFLTFTSRILTHRSRSIVSIYASFSSASNLPHDTTSLTHDTNRPLLCPFGISGDIQHILNTQHPQNEHGTRRLRHVRRRPSKVRGRPVCHQRAPQRASSQAGKLLRNFWTYCQYLLDTAKRRSGGSRRSRSEAD
jgi:hypothetical protein